MLPRTTGWIASHMQRKLITVTLTLCISVLVFICLVPLEKEFPVKNYHYQGKYLDFIVTMFVYGINVL